MSTHETRERKRSPRTAVEPPAHDERWDEPVTPVSGEHDREVWLALARDVYGVDPDVLAERSTSWIVGRCLEARNRHYRYNDE